VRQQAAARKEAPDVPDHAERLVECYRQLVAVLLEGGDYAEAVRAVAALIGVRPKEYRDALLAARLLVRCDRAAPERGDYRERARRQTERAAKLCPEDVQAENNLAWTLLVVEELHDPKSALTLAKRAVARQPKEGKYQHTLGLAQYRTGDLAGAAKSLERSMELRDGGDAYEWFVLAMVYAKRGDGKKARDWYDRAKKWLEQKAADNEELRAFEREARAEMEANGAKDSR
jgi:tetratricopeptide (TPR) repeat protein